MRPRNADDFTPAELAAAAIDMDRVLEREPQLGDFGFGVWTAPKTREERDADFASIVRAFASRGRWRSSWRRVAGSGSSARSRRSTGAGRATA